MINLSNEQNEICDKIFSWMKTKEKRLVLGGYAGTGKTTIARHLASKIENTTFLAYTGKAANVLREKGCSAQTVHGAIYSLKEIEEGGELIFTLNRDSDIKYCALVVVDEYSMLPEKIINDLESIAKKVLYLGDPFQLPPVEGNCILNPNLFLETVHRQALDSPILRSATLVRAGENLNFGDYGEFVYKSITETDPSEYDNSDQVIVGYNRTRKSWNNRFRQKLGFTGELPNEGEKIICLKNNHEMGLFNGMIDLTKGKYRDIDKYNIFLNFGDFKGVKVWKGHFLGWTPPKFRMKGIEQFDYGYVITAHKSQGSEFKKVTILNQPIGRDEIERRRWIYTAITRAQEKCLLVEPS